MLELRNIHKSLGGKAVLEDVSLRVEHGETLVVVGSSGAGKSVALQHMIGLMHPDRGEVLVDGQPMHKATGSRLARLREYFGMLFQGGAMINWMNIFDNIALPLRERNRWSEEEIAERVHQALALVSLEEVEHKMPVQLSGGMLKRAGLARAIIMRPPIILYDEPTSGLDPILSRNIDKLILHLQKKLEVTSVVVTHDLISAFSVGDKVALLHQGRIAIVGTPEEFRHADDDFVQEFINAQKCPEFEAATGKGDRVR